MMTQTDIAAAIHAAAETRLQPAGFDVRDEQHPAWVWLHPSGFGTVNNINDGDVFCFSSLRIAETTTHLFEEWLPAYLDAIVAWWEMSTLEFSLGMTAGTVLLDFATKAPIDFILLAWNPLVLSGTYDLIDWFCPERRP